MDAKNNFYVLKFVKMDNFAQNGLQINFLKQNWK
jgi:hypothetical protein